jgi:hypothetical protein
MIARLGLIALTAAVLASSGCAMCCAPYDDNYPYYGGRWVRDNPTHGRVGSAFEPAGHRVEDGAATEPTPAAETPMPLRDGSEYLPVE